MSFVNSPLPVQSSSACHQKPSSTGLQLTHHSSVYFLPQAFAWGLACQTEELTAPENGLHPFWLLPEPKWLPIPQTLVFPIPYVSVQILHNQAFLLLFSTGGVFVWGSAVDSPYHYSLCYMCSPAQLQAHWGPDTWLSFAFCLCAQRSTWHISLLQCWLMNKWRMLVARSWRQTDLDTLNKPFSEKSGYSWYHSSKLHLAYIIFWNLSTREKANNPPDFLNSGRRQWVWLWPHQYQGIICWPKHFSRNNFHLIDS